MFHVSHSLSKGAAITDPFPVIHSILSPEALSTEILPLYNLGSQVKCIFLSRGVNDTYLVQTPTKRYILRIYRTGWRILSDILYEIEVIIHLAQKGIPVSLPIAQADGDFVCTLQAPEGPRHLVLFTYASGVPLNRHDATDSYYHGRALAAIHNATDDFLPSHTRKALDLEFLIDQPLQAIEPLCICSSGDWSYLQDLTKHLRLQIQHLAAQDWNWGICHGDCHMLNDHMSDDYTITFFDFDCCSTGWRAYDLATVRWSEGFYQMDPDDALWNAFLKGYMEQRPLTRTDLVSIPMFVALREIWHTALIAWLQPSSGAQGFDKVLQRTLRLLREWETARLKS